MCQLRRSDMVGYAYVDIIQLVPSDYQYLRKKTGAVSHLSDDDEEVTTPSPTKQSDVKKEKRKRERKKRPDYIVKLKGLPLNSNKVCT